MGDTLATTAVLAVGAGLLLYVDANWGSRTSMERFQRKARVCSIESREVGSELRVPFFERCYAQSNLERNPEPRKSASPELRLKLEFTCKNKKKTMAMLLANMLVHVSLMSVFIAVFFFTWAAHEEQLVIARQTREIIQELVDETKTLVDNTATNDKIRQAFAAIRAPDTTGADAQVATANGALVRKAALALGAGVALLALVVGFLVWRYELSLRHLIRDNLVVLAAAAIVEFSFLTFLASAYEPSNGAFVKWKTFGIIQQWVQAS